jgi:acyl dehydratase
MIDPAFIGHQFPAFTVDVEAGRLRQFAKATGETRPEYIDADAASARGWPTLPVPATFLFALEMEQPDPWGYMRTLDVDLANVLHGEQEFIYHQMAWAGDTLAFSARIQDIVSKRGGAMELVTKITDVKRDGDIPVAQLRTVIAVINERAAR